MYLKSIKINNFRKFGTENNEIQFVDARSYKDKGININIAETTTLIVGKNNSGKTTVVEALNKLINDNNFSVTDFNLLYLGDIIKKYNKSGEKFEAPSMEFDICIGIENDTTDLVTNLIPLMTLEDIEKSQIEVKIKYEIEDQEIFNKDIKRIYLEHRIKRIRNNKVMKLIDNSKFKINYYNKNGDKVANFKLKDLMELKPVKANNIQGNKCLSKAFNKILDYRYNEVLGDKSVLESAITSINTNLTKKINKEYTGNINGSLEKIIHSDKLQVLLSADLTFKSLLNNLLKYEYVEGNINIPEEQFGLGYTNLVMIIAELIEYMEKYPDESFNSKVNLISIEEPETFMHPQMQEVFIKNINEAIKTLLESKGKNINSQLIITTHSSHILNSKIHTGNTFNNINYITNEGSYAASVNLNDEKIKPKGEDKEKDLKFLKKHIKYKVSELFFSDAVILVEGITEYTILPYYIDNDERLNKHYISIFNINGAHGLVYSELIKLLKVPTLIITDIDIKRETEEKGEKKIGGKKVFKQIENLKARVTTNQTIIKYNNNDNNLETLNKRNLEDQNIYILYQGESINGYYATSFEEAFILTNYENGLLNRALKSTKPRIYDEIVGKKDSKADDTKLNYLANRDNSYKWQRKLSDSKSSFANELLYELITNESSEEIPELPKYIKDGIDILVNKLGGE